jgi:putative transposase
MQLVEQHVIRKGDERFLPIDNACFASKNLYNLANYHIRQHYIETKKYLNWYALDKALQKTEAYLALPAKVSQQVLKLLHNNWVSFFEANKVYAVKPDAFTGRPSLPKYKEKKSGRNVLIYTDQAFSIKSLRNGIIAPSRLNIEVKTKQENIDQVRIVPRCGYYVVEVVYQAEIVKADLDESLVAGIDIGLSNLAALTSNKVGLTPRLINGKPLKSINQFYNKRKANLQSRLVGKYTSKQIEVITQKKNRRVNHYMHVASRRIVDLLVKEKVATLVIGKNDGWKQDINLGKRNNQNFVSIPHARFISMIQYKCELVGIKVILTEESYTSKCSFLDNESIEKHEVYLGKRVKRGLFRSSSGKTINADVNGSLDIIRKAIPNAFSNGILGLVVAPVRLVLQT